jgi:preprotein translocase subunit YajC
LFCLALSILLLADVTPSSLPTTAIDTASAVRSADTAPAAPTVALDKPSTGPTIEAGPRIAPTTAEVTHIVAPAAADAGKTVTVKGTFIKVDPVAKTVTVKTDAGEDTYAVTPNTAITIDNTQVTWDSLASATSATGTITATGKTATSIVAETPPWWAKIFNNQPMLLLILPLGLFLLLSVRNKRKQEKAQQQKLGAIKRGDRIQTIGGIIGNVVQTEDARVLVKVDESNNTKIWFARSAVGRVLGEEKSSDAKTTK